MSETGSDTRSGIGARLRAGRERMSLTQLQMAEKLHVDPKVVESLETERFDALGAPVFVRGHLKRYADFIGENAAQLVEIYAGAKAAALPDLTRLPKAAPDNKPSKLAVPALLVLIAFVLLGVFWWIFQSVKSTSEIRPAPNAREVPVEPDLSPPIGGEGTATGQPAGAATSADAASTDAPRAADGGAPGAGAGSSSSAAGASTSVAPSATGNASAASNANTGATNARSATTGAASAPGSAGTGATPPAAPMQVTLKFSADSWVEVYDSKGEKLFYDIGSANSQKSLSGTPPFRVIFGNAPGVTFDVNGKPGAIPENALKDDTAQFVINPSGRIVRARTQPQGPQASGSPQRAAAPPEGT